MLLVALGFDDYAVEIQVLALEVQDFVGASAGREELARRGCGISTHIPRGFRREGSDLVGGIALELLATEVRSSKALILGSSLGSVRLVLEDVSRGLVGCDSFLGVAINDALSAAAAGLRDADLSCAGDDDILDQASTRG